MENIIETSRLSRVVWRACGAVWVRRFCDWALFCNHPPAIDDLDNWCLYGFSLPRVKRKIVLSKKDLIGWRRVGLAWFPLETPFLKHFLKIKVKNSRKKSVPRIQKKSVGKSVDWKENVASIKGLEVIFYFFSTIIVADDADSGTKPSLYFHL